MIRERCKREIGVEGNYVAVSIIYMNQKVFVKEVRRTRPKVIGHDRAAQGTVQRSSLPKAVRLLLAASSVVDARLKALPSLSHVMTDLGRNRGRFQPDSVT